MTTDETRATLANVKHGGCVQLGTPGSRWASTGQPDPHGSRYDCERAALAMGDLSDDELANAVLMHGDRRLSVAEMISGVLPGGAYLAAAKDRIRWLSRALAAAETLSDHPSPGGQDVRERDGWRKMQKTAASQTRKDGVGACDALYELAVKHGASDTEAAGFAHQVNGALALLEAQAHDGLHREGAMDSAPPAQAMDLGKFFPAVRMLVVSARTSGGTAGRDAHLCEALDRVEALLPPFDSQAVGK